eukprot:TRINITY_DN11454_c0_g1_i1.p1 TRINITY_DN11454_c0_g1~~TRINITY_DN11454_c0_g1_i1.p1  ORF type:complete len:107 (-),score=6.08 TRINITY_DN11454_c0_g1_i1:1101-1421(-)
MQLTLPWSCLKGCFSWISGYVLCPYSCTSCVKNYKWLEAERGFNWMRRKGPDNVTMGIIVEACHRTWLFMTTSSPSCKLIPCKSASVGSLFYTESQYLHKVYMPSR